MKISIITATYNSLQNIEQCINSVLSQTYKNIELIIIDGESTDGTIEYLRNIKDARIKVISEPDSGIYEALNKGTNLASGDIIGILHSDDFYIHNDILTKINTAFQEQNIDALYGDLLYVDELNTDEIIRYWKSGKYNPKKWLWGWMPPHPTVFIKKECYQKYGNFNLSLWGASDYELMLRFMYKHKISVTYLPEVLVKMRIGGQSNRSFANRIKAHLEDVEAWRINKLKQYPWTTLLKPIRKIHQYFMKYNGK